MGIQTPANLGSIGMVEDKSFGILVKGYRGRAAQSAAIAGIADIARNRRDRKGRFAPESQVAIGVPRPARDL
jgi:hypothetical protein